MIFESTCTATDNETCYVSVRVAIDCPYHKTCCDAHTNKCKVCRNNKQRSRFEPVETVRIPYIYDNPQPYYPYFPYRDYPSVPCTGSSGVFWDWPHKC